MKNIFSILTVFMFLFSSCNTDENGLKPFVPSREFSILAGAPQMKTVLVGDDVKWERGDEIAVVFTRQAGVAHVGNFQTDFEGDSPASFAEFSGTISPDVVSEGAYDDMGYAVYPSSAVSGNGLIDFTLPSSQSVRADGSFVAGLNLSSTAVSLADLREDGHASVKFHNSLAMLRFTPPANLKEMTIVGTSPFAGKAPLVVEDGTIVIDSQAQWASADKEFGVTLKPSAGAQTLPQGVPCHLLIYPGAHTSLTIRQVYTDIGEISTVTHRL